MTAPFDSDRFKEAMATFPSGTTIVTTTDADNRWWGFTASSFCSVSMEPPLVLACLANSAECYPAFMAAQRWNIHILPHRHGELAMRFAKRGADKFGGAGFIADSHGLPILPDVSVTLRCSSFSKIEAGDHHVLIGEVDEVDVTDEPPFVYFRRKFHQLEFGVG